YTTLFRSKHALVVEVGKDDLVHTATVGQSERAHVRRPQRIGHDPGGSTSFGDFGARGRTHADSAVAEPIPAQIDALFKVRASGSDRFSVGPGPKATARFGGRRSADQCRCDKRKSR